MKNIIQISKWSARLGNNLRQLYHAHLTAELHDCVVCYPKHNILGECKKSGTILFTGGFMKPSDEILLNFTDDDRMRVSKKYIRPLLHDIINCVHVPCDIIVIHIRGGDIMKPKLNPNYTQPPLDYYVKIFEHLNITDYSKIWVVCDGVGKKNPVELLLKNLGCIIKSDSIEESISIISNATTFISSLSTFAMGLFFLSNNAKRIYFPEFFKYTLNNIESFSVTLPNYIKRGEWIPDTKQLGMMVNYKGAIVKKFKL